MQKPRFSDKLRYKFDNLLAKGTPAMLGLLAIAFVAGIAVFTLAVFFLAPAPEGETLDFGQLFWRSMMRTLDSGTMGGDTGVYGYVMLGVTVIGIFILSTLIGILNSGLESKLDALRKGRSPVIERDHTVILGWSDQIFTIIPELVEANESRRRAVIVVMGDRDKVEMEEEIAERVEDLKTTKVVCRSGSPLDLADLRMPGLDGSRSIIVLSQPEAADPDAEVIKTVLALVNHEGRRSEPYHIVAEIRDPKNLEAVKIAGGKEVCVVLAGDMTARIMAQTSRQSGLSVVYQELLDFGGDEIYVAAEPALEGRTWLEACAAYEKSAPMGLVGADGKVTLNPPAGRTLAKGESLVVIAEDDSAIEFTGVREAVLPAQAAASSKKAKPKAESILILGWNWRSATLIRELDAYVAKGSILTVVPGNTASPELSDPAFAKSLKSFKPSIKAGDPSDRKLLESLDVFGYDSVILSSDEEAGVQESDARTLIALIHLRDMASKSGKDLHLISEMLDVKNRELAQIAKVDDFIVSDKLVGLMLSQVSENAVIHAIFEDLLSPEGSEIYLLPAENYVKPGVEVDFFAILKAASLKGHTAIGYRLESESGDASAGYGVHINPFKSAKITFKEGDKLVVLAEEA